MKNRFLRYLFIPFAILYGLIVRLRNYCFDCGLLRQTPSPIFTICVGNLSVGGTGKTPHVEYLANLLKDSLSIAILSRGYGRNTKGFILANSSTDSSQIGDEPCQYQRKFSDINVAVCEKRVEGLNRLKALKNPPLIVLLDDAFQHRYVKPNYSILLTDYKAPYCNDCVLPSGRLREDRKGAKRAHTIIVTKAPPTISQEEKQAIIAKIKPNPFQNIYFSFIEYGTPIPLTDSAKQVVINLNNMEYSVLLFTGIANPKPLQDYLKIKSQVADSMIFKDHHQFTQNDLQQLKTRYENIHSGTKFVVTSEKDAMRLSAEEINFLNNIPIYYIPIQVNFQGTSKERFDKQILDLVKGL